MILTLASCQKKSEPLDCGTGDNTLFSLLSAEETGIDFRNDLEYTEEFNTYTYRNFYNGGGVAIGDLDKDGLPDIFFTGNMVGNRLYLNKGNLTFDDITDDVGLDSGDVWSTGVSFADVNGDGWLDIYICKSGKPEGANRHNELFINQGTDEDGHLNFEEKAKEYGVADYGLSTHTAFFDYDKDGDLDMYLLNNSIRSVGGYTLKKDQRLIRDPNGGNKLYRNDGDSFTDVSEKAGIYGSAIGFGLGVTIGDINRDGWQDIFVSNDFFEKDYLYINNGDGTFTESLEQIIGEISLGSMGADMADINNDGWPEIFVTEMLPKEESRLKTKAIFEDWNKYQANVNAGYHRQFPRNVLQLNQGSPNAEGHISMSEISRFSGVEATDWSWGALIADYDNDGNKDMFVANGIFKDLIDLDYLNFYADPITTARLFKERGSYLKQLIDSIPSNPIPNFAFANNGDLTFSNTSEEWGLNCPSFSNGSAYGDLDNDGDLDLVLNNVNMPAFVYRNNAETKKQENHFINLKFVGLESQINTAGLGTQATVYAGDKTYYQELAPMRGYQSTVDDRLHFGLGSVGQIDSIRVQWSDGDIRILRDVAVNQFLTISYSENTDSSQKRVGTDVEVGKPWFRDVSDSISIPNMHKKSSFNDFDRDLLLFDMVSAGTAHINTADVDGDGRTDIFLGGNKGEAAAFYKQGSDGRFQKVDQPAFKADKSSLDTNSAFFDADNDGDLDLYVCSGGNEFPNSSSSLKDRLYVNNGEGIFVKSEQWLPTNRYENSSAVAPADYDGDGDMDLFVGIRAKPFNYGEPCNGYLLKNNGNGQFTEVGEDVAPELRNLGMITDAEWFDYDQDGDQDLILVGDWMPLTLFENNNGKLVKKINEIGFARTNGFWNTLEIADIDKDGRLDIIAGNLGENTRLRASEDKPVSMYVEDFDKNGKPEHIITIYNGEQDYPLVGRSDLVEQLPYLKKKYLKYHSYKEQTVEDIFGKKAIQGALKLEVFNTASAVFLNQGSSFEKIELPAEAQLSRIFGLQVRDFDQDGKLDILTGGNFYWSKPEVGINDGSRGVLLKGFGDGSFESMSMAESGLQIDGEIREIKPLRVKGAELLIISRLNDSLVVLKKNALQ
ncbi:MAG: VCBS repeat-containing protein [Bacteroidota bacterium]|uniref:VCBS repeat-containing protein n=1 Tax=Flagellimonas profundi TaxID=2915620 RepID=A0ABS3FJG3_9FLAO|nr:VCBS repeat-containing protein [Allomuricauda profundi]MBO0343310.1 VCBS repeat-containing protein [Allomuricauda profundi]MEC7772178.1 VCBS repeat-containing protein [Bacteroidota bacterium]